MCRPLPRARARPLERMPYCLALPCIGDAEAKYDLAFKSKDNDGSFKKDGTEVSSPPVKPFNARGGL